MRSDRGGLIAIIGCVTLAALGLGISLERDRPIAGSVLSSKEQRDVQQQADRNRAGLPRIAEAVISNPEPKSEAERDSRDLAAQEANAAWAFWALAISVVIAIITGIGTALLYQQIKLTRRAVQDTSDATRAMQVGNRIAKRTVEQQLRPWVDLSISDVKAATLNGTPIVTAVLTLRNLGQSPALDLGYCFFMALGENPKAHIDETIKILKERTSDWQDFHLFQGGEHEITVSCEHTGEVEEGWEAFVYAIAIYRTPFSDSIRYTARLYDLVEVRTAANKTYKGWPMNALFKVRPSRTFVGYAT